MFKLIDRKIITLLCSTFLLIWNYVKTDGKSIVGTLFLYFPGNNSQNGTRNVTHGFKIIRVIGRIAIATNTDML